jgi:hypothetical protein
MTAAQRLVLSIMIRQRTPLINLHKYVPLLPSLSEISACVMPIARCLISVAHHFGQKLKLKPS